MSDTENVDASAVSANAVTVMKVNELKYELNRRKLKTTGKKDELVAKLEAALLLEDAREENNDEENQRDVISDEESNKTVLYGARNIREFKEKLNHYETMKNNIKSWHRVEKPKIETKMNSKSDENEKKSFQRCYNCGDRGHVSVKCPNKAKGTKCIKCGEFGHVSAKCKKQAGRSESNVIEVRKKNEQKTIDNKIFKEVVINKQKKSY
ncbi:uncharacterized protein LOC108736830 [Agrilus planipennis]|uniref:Uncharacterized protein LOC108736830 n=1 Tax=Agrilus planipennis TaxID=224129 RepID=A0A1W4WXY4_AGRPL|nr:uncharacterized protein LOC108736830 [Agrilus planipennis]